MELLQQFEKAAEESKTLSEKPSNDILLQLYSLYKQGSVGDINIDLPSNSLDIVKKAKFNTWKVLKGITR